MATSIGQKVDAKPGSLRVKLTEGIVAGMKSRRSHIRHGGSGLFRSGVKERCGISRASGHPCCCASMGDAQANR